MFKQMQVRKLVSDEAERTGKLLADMEMRARRLPQGSLCENKGYLYRVFYEAGKRRQVIIPKGFEGREELVDELRERRYLSEAIPVLRGNLECCDRFAKGSAHMIRGRLGGDCRLCMAGMIAGSCCCPGMWIRRPGQRKDTRSMTDFRRGNCTVRKVASGRVPRRRRILRRSWNSMGWFSGMRS